MMTAFGYYPYNEPGIGSVVIFSWAMLFNIIAYYSLSLQQSHVPVFMLRKNPTEEEKSTPAPPSPRSLSALLYPHRRGNQSLNLGPPTLSGKSHSADYSAEPNDLSSRLGRIQSAPEMKPHPNPISSGVKELDEWEQKARQGGQDAEKSLPESNNRRLQSMERLLNTKKKSNVTKTPSGVSVLSACTEEKSSNGSFTDKSSAEGGAALEEILTDLQVQNVDDCDSDGSEDGPGFFSRPINRQKDVTKAASNNYITVPNHAEEVCKYSMFSSGQ
jgi:hypothetical protein